MYDIDGAGYRVPKYVAWHLHGQANQYYTPTKVKVLYFYFFIEIQ